METFKMINADGANVENDNNIKAEVNCKEVGRTEGIVTREETVNINEVIHHERIQAVIANNKEINKLNDSTRQTNFTEVQYLTLKKNQLSKNLENSVTKSNVKIANSTVRLQQRLFKLVEMYKVCYTSFVKDTTNQILKEELAQIRKTLAKLGSNHKMSRMALAELDSAIYKCNDVTENKYQQRIRKRREITFPRTKMPTDNENFLEKLPGDMSDTPVLDDSQCDRASPPTPPNSSNQDEQVTKLGFMASNELLSRELAITAREASSKRKKALTMKICEAIRQRQHRHKHRITNRQRSRNVAQHVNTTSPLTICNSEGRPVQPPTFCNLKEAEISLPDRKQSVGCRNCSATAADQQLCSSCSPLPLVSRKTLPELKKLKQQLIQIRCNQLIEKEKLEKSVFPLLDSKALQERALKDQLKEQQELISKIDQLRNFVMLYQRASSNTKCSHPLSPPRPVSTPAPPPPLSL